VRCSLRGRLSRGRSSREPPVRARSLRGRSTSVRRSPRGRSLRGRSSSARRWVRGRSVRGRSSAVRRRSLYEREPSPDLLAADLPAPRVSRAPRESEADCVKRVSRLGRSSRARPSARDDVREPPERSSRRAESLRAESLLHARPPARGCDLSRDGPVSREVLVSRERWVARGRSLEAGRRASLRGALVDFFLALPVRGLRAGCAMTLIRIGGALHATSDGRARAHQRVFSSQTENRNCG